MWKTLENGEKGAEDKNTPRTGACSTPQNAAAAIDTSLKKKKKKTGQGKRERERKKERKKKESRIFPHSNHVSFLPAAVHTHEHTHEHTSIRTWETTTAVAADSSLVVLSFLPRRLLHIRKRGAKDPSRRVAAAADNTDAKVVVGFLSLSLSATESLVTNSLPCIYTEPCMYYFLCLSKKSWSRKTARLSPERCFFNAFIL